MMRLTLCTLALLSCVSFEGEALAQVYPTKPVRIVVSASPGGGDDFVTRIIAPRLAEALGQQLFVENRPGAGGLVGQTFVSKAAPDGYTLLLGGGSMAGSRYVNANVSYDVLRDFTPVSQVETAPFFMIVHPSVPAKNLKDYIALARSKPGKMNFGTNGTGQIPYWSAILFNSMARIEAVEIQYKDSASVNVMAGQIDYSFAPAIVVVSNREKLRALAVTTATRADVLPDVPTVAEAALPGYEMYASRSILGPAGMSRDIVASLNKAIGRALTTPEVRDRFIKSGSQPT